VRALVTGAASGLGRALAIRLAAHGARVTALDRDAAGLATLPAPAEPLAADLVDTAALEGLGETLAARGPYDTVIHAAGISATGRFEALCLDEMARVIAVNLLAPMALTAALLRARALRPGGSLVLIGSLSHRLGYPGAADYAASKDGIASFGRSLRRPLARAGIKVVTVLPGPLDTPHAARHAPPGASGRGRMRPEIAADLILARMRRGGSFTPGLGPAVAGAFGLVAPGLATRIMHRTLYLPLVAAAADAGSATATLDPALPVTAASAGQAGPPA
jgi:cyclic-di-GMP-binding biofilm dispersal mediator protein